MLAAAYQVPHDSAFDDFTLIVNTICERTGIPTKEFPTGGWGAVARIVGQLLVDKGSLNRVAHDHTVAKGVRKAMARSVNGLYPQMEEEDVVERVLNDIRSALTGSSMAPPDT